MLNERKTEQIVRTHFEQYLEILEIEEQQSDDKKIDKLLKSASKQGLGKGYPDFIISYPNQSDFLIVIECKADLNKHESESHLQYADYAVDGVLLYASYLSKEFDVLAIAVSGESQETLKVSHFLHLKTEKDATNIFGEQLLTANDYLNGYLKSPEKFRQDYDALLEFAKELNIKLHTYKIRESDRALLISAILIALESDAFKKSYASHSTPSSLASILLETVLHELAEAGMDHKNLENLKIQFGFIKTDTSLSKERKILKELIDEIDQNINQFIKTHEYFDVLGQLYIEFLQYANSDKGLGIVLTPPHITELFADLAQVNKNSIVYDNCTGTGGFLISAMKKMILDAKGDEAKIKQIKSKQLLGTEYQAHIFALSVSNMYIHQDGKTNITNGSCFEAETIDHAKKQQPTIGFLNPPYKADKKADVDELNFIFNNLECLCEGGTCIAIVPMQCALAQKGKIFELKKKLLEQHTLEAVLSMPDELFFNSKVNVVSCIMIFTAHKPHSQHKKTYFGYYKNDGFVKRKTKGRIDVLGNWQSIQKKWVKHFINRETEEGLSVNQIVSNQDEWCAEAYMQTDYSHLNPQNFEDTILKYVTFLLGNRLLGQVHKKPLLENKMLLNPEEWLMFKLDTLFETKGSQTTSLLELEEYGKGKYPYVTTQATDNGTAGFYDFFSEDGNVLTVDSAVLGYCAYQKFAFSASDHVEKLIPKFEMNEYTAMFLVTILNLEQYRYNYGRKCSQARMKKMSIKLPAKDGKADFSFMESYVKTLPFSSSVLITN